MTTSTRLLNYRAKNGDSAAAVALAEILGAKAEGRQPDVRAAHARQGTLPSQQRLGASAAPASLASKPEPATPQLAAITQWDVTFARESASQSATSRERERWAKVFDSEHSKGRERVCATLLSAPKGWSADAILAELPTLPTDQQQASSTPAAMAASDASWNRAYGLRAASASTAPVAEAATGSDDAWARAYGSAHTTPDKTTADAQPADDAWARAYRSNAR